ncbi:N4-gp56 family major capsid protein [Streptomyces sp. NPDC002644]
MALTTASDLIVPEVWEDVTQATFLGQVRVAGSAAVMQDDTLVGQPGDTINFPKWGALGELDTLTEGVPMTPSTMTQTASKATIEEAGKAVEITDTALLTAIGDPIGEAQRQMGILAARRVDASLIAQAQADETAQGGGTPLAANTGATFNWASVVEGMAAFGDEFDPAQFAGVYINSAQMASLFNDSQFINAANLGAATPVTTGQIGVLGGMPVIVTDRVAAGKWLLLKRNSLGLLYKRRPIVERDRDILKRSTVVTTNVHYAVKRLDDRGVFVGTVAA